LPAAEKEGAVSDNLVTVATYTEPTQAHLAKQHLEEEGVRCYLADDSTTGMDWLLGNAIGWIKLQVMENDAERATGILLRLSPGDQAEEPPSTAITEAGPRGEPPPPREEEEEPENERSKQATRAFRAALLGLFFCPVEFYATYILVDVWGSDEPLDDRARRHATYASLINVPFMAAVVLIVLSYLASSLDLW
jgi:hypothetical protein